MDADREPDCIVSGLQHAWVKALMSHLGKREAQDTPPCVVEGLEHAFVPRFEGNDPSDYARCGRTGCGLKRVRDSNGKLTFWRSSKPQPQD